MRIRKPLSVTGSLELVIVSCVISPCHRNFIDVSTKPTLLDEKDAEDRSTHYLEQLQVTTAVVSSAKNPLPTLLALPTPYFSGPQAAEGATEAMTISSVSVREKAQVRAIYMH